MLVSGSGRVQRERNRPGLSRTHARDNDMALKKEGPEFDHDDEVLLLEPGIMLDESSADEQPSPRATPKATTSFSSKQHKHIDYTRALDATQLYLNEIGFSPLLTPEEEVHCGFR